jgi:hypothetical protein
VGVALLVAALVPAPGSGQRPDSDLAAAPWVQDFGIAAANILAGAATAALTAAIRREPVPDAFWQGAVGGGVVFLGKRLAAARFDGAGFLGRELASVGSSVIANGGAGRGWVEEIWLPVGPVWFQVSPSSLRAVRVNLYDVGAVVWASRRSELELDWRRSLSTGSMVFLADRHNFSYGRGQTAGLTVGGVMLLSVAAPNLEAVQRHETTHVIQNDFTLLTLQRPVEQWGWSLLVHRPVPFDVGALFALPTPEPIYQLQQTEAELLEAR